MKILRFIFGGILIFSTVFSLFFANSVIGENTIKTTDDYKAILTVWQIDLFEGGKGSRRQFLVDASKTFEKQNKGVLILVSAHTKDTAEERMKKGEYPDIISFSLGVDVSNLKEINLGVQSFGKIGGKTYAVPWCRGGYVLIENLLAKGEKLVVSNAEYTQPLLAAYLNGLSFSDYNVLKPLDAYVNFVSGNSRYFLGTQRDIIRLENRDLNTKITSLKEFSDLYQYLSITTTDDKKYELANKFIEHLLSSGVQSKLNKIGMCSPYFSVEFDNLALNELQNEKIISSISPFTLSTEAKELKTLSLNALSGDDGAKNKIKKMLTCLENLDKI